jgi:hypothetical protein
VETRETGLQPWNVVKWLVASAVCVLALIGIGVNAIIALAVGALVSVTQLKIDPAVPLALCLLFMVTSPLMMALQQESAAQGLASVAYFFLAMGVVLLLVENIRRKPEGEEGPPED